MVFIGILELNMALVPLENPGGTSTTSDVGSPPLTLVPHQVNLTQVLAWSGTAGNLSRTHRFADARMIHEIRESPPSDD